MVKMKSRRRMGWIAMGFHWTMIVCTVGLWTPVYLAARRRRVTVTHLPSGYAGPLPPTH
ncbi:hypothetical protein ACWC1C_07700 [Streptomyces sp. NPDC001705]